MENSPDISINTRPTLSGQIGIMRLLRRAQHNALNHDMILTLKSQLERFAQDPTIEAVLISGDGDKAFCAGGDIRQLYEHMKAQHTNLAKFFWDEYRLNYAIANFQKPYIALMDGITMGGGVGISIHGNFRIATENLSLAMPETGIGFFPDIGASYFLPRLPHNFGYMLGLAGSRLNAADTCYLGLTDFYVPVNNSDAMFTAICQTQFGDDLFAEITEIMGNFAETPPKSELESIAQEVEACFAHTTVEDIISALEENNNPWAQQTLSALLKKSPTSLKVTLKQLQLGATQDLATCLKMEYRLVNHFLNTPDFMEGVRAVIIDKDNQPNWQPQTLAELNEDDVNQFFMPLDDHELVF